MKLGNPPVVEAWIEFRFRVSGEAAPWDQSDASRFFNVSYQDAFKVKDYLGRWDLTVQTEAGRPSLLENRLLMERARACNEDASRYVQAGRDVLIYNMLRLHRAWPEYPELRGGALEAYEKYVQFTKPEGLASIGLHYRDVVSIPTDTGQAVNLEDYLRIGPDYPVDVFRTVGALRLVLVFPEASKVGTLQFEMCNESVPPEPLAAPPARFRLDWHLRSDWKGSLDREAIRSWLDTAHADIVRVFQASLTERCWELFDQEDI